MLSGSAPAAGRAVCRAHVRPDHCVGAQCDPAPIDAAVAGYCRHVQPEDHELERLPDAIRATSLLVEARSVVVGPLAADVAEQLADRGSVAQIIADRARLQFAR